MPIIQGHGLATAAVVPVVSVMPIIDGGKVVPCRRADRRREGGARRADHRQPGRSCRSSRATARNGRGGARGFRHAHYRRREGCAVVPIIDLAAVVPVVSIDSREAGADHPGPRPGKLVPIDAGRCPGWWCRAGPPSCRRVDRRREGRARRAAPPCRSTAGSGADHPGPRLATAAVVPLVPCCRVDHPGPRPGKLVPIIDAGRCPGRLRTDGLYLGRAHPAGTGRVLNLLEGPLTGGGGADMGRKALFLDGFARFDGLNEMQ